MYRVYVCKVKNIRPAKNADRLNLCEVYDNTTVVDKSVNENDLYLYFPIDGQISEEFGNANNLFRKKDENGNNCGGFIDPIKRNITAIKLRGNRSDGLVLPLTALQKFGNISTLKEGDTVETFNGHVIAIKYIPIKRQSNNIQKGSRGKKPPKVLIAPLFARHADTEQLAYNLNAFKYGDLVEFTLKMHGTSGRTAYVPVLKGYKRTLWDKITHKEGTPIYEWGYVSGTRRVELDSYNGGFYGSNEFRRKYHEFFKGKLHKGEEIFYEIVGYTDDGVPIMGTGNTEKLGKDFVKKYGKNMEFSYGCSPNGYINKDEAVEGQLPRNDIYVYRMTMTNEDGDIVEYTPDFMRYRCEQMGVKTVPVFNKFLLKQGDPAEPNNKLIRESVMLAAEEYCGSGSVLEDIVDPSHIREGTVVRIVNRPTFTAFKHKNFEFKVLSGIIKDAAAARDGMTDDMISEL